MLRKYLRKFHYKYRFVPWYRKAYYYKCKKDKMDEIIAKYKEPEELADPKCEKIKEGYDPLPVQIWFLLQ